MAQPAFSLVAIAFNMSVVPSFPRWRPAGEGRLVRSARDGVALACPMPCAHPPYGSNGRKNTGINPTLGIGSGLID